MRWPNRWRIWLVSVLGVLLIAGLAWGQTRGLLHVFHRTQTGVAPGASAHVLGYTTLTLHIAAAATPSFNVHFQGSLEGTNWTLHHCQSTARVQVHAVMEMHTALGTGIWRCNVTGFAYFQAHVTAYTGGPSAGHSVTIIGTVLDLPGLL